MTAARFNSIRTGRYPLNWWIYIIGYGPNVHVTGSTILNRDAKLKNINNGGAMSVTFTVGIDYRYLFNAFGAMYHLIREVLHIGGPRKPC